MNSVCFSKFSLREKLSQFIQQESKNFKNPIIKYEVVNQLVKNVPNTVDQLKTKTSLSDAKIKKYGEKIIDIVNQPIINNNSSINFLWCVFDLETTGLSYETDDIIQLCINFIIKDENSNYQSHSMFTRYISTNKNIPFKITQLTGIDSSCLVGAQNFNQVYQEISVIIDSIVDYYKINKVVWLAHNGLRFDFPFWFSKKKNITKNHKYQEWFVDTYDILKNITLDPPLENKKLNTIHKHFFGCDIENAHKADMDVIALTRIFMLPVIQNEIYNFIYPEQYILDRINKKQKCQSSIDINQQILTRFLTLVKNEPSIVANHLSYFLEKYPNTLNHQQVSDYLNNYKSSLK